MNHLHAQSGSLTEAFGRLRYGRVFTPDHSPVHSDPELMGGTLVFRGTRVPAQTLLDYLDDGFSLEEFLEMFPSVVHDDTLEFLRLARDIER